MKIDESEARYQPQNNYCDSDIQTKITNIK